jgi:8-oxo-dGTP pyrophosphatase MutT (NUDIX family)
MDTMADSSQQYAALPVRHSDGKVAVLLISSRETRRWVIPKGWPVYGLAPSAAAALEAFEEAGVEGQMSSEPIGSYTYEKRLKNGARLRCRVDVYMMEVAREHGKWPEVGERSRRWFDPEGAALAVEEPELAALIRALR